MNAQDRTGSAQSEPRVVAALDQASAAIDDLVPVVDNPGNTVLVDSSRGTRWAGLLFAVCAVALIPWIVVIAFTLPSRQLSPNYDIAWSGYDVLLLIGLGGVRLAQPAFARDR